MKSKRLLFSVALCWLAVTASAAAADYVPPRGSWAVRDPATAGFDPAKLAVAVELAKQKYVYVDREHDLVVVLRWVPEFDQVIPAFLEALRR